MKKKLTILLTFFSLFVYGQQFVPFYSQYMYDGSYINPAFAGTRNVFSTSVFYKNQMIGFDGAPSVYSVSGHAPLKNKRIALGLLCNFETIGVSKRYGVFSSYAYHIRMGSNGQKLSIGLGAGCFIENHKWSDIIRNDEDDEEFMNDSRTFALPNISAGLYYTSSTFYIGLSAPYFINYSYNTPLNKYEISSSISDYSYYMTSGYKLTVTSTLKLWPSVLFIYNSNSQVLDLNLNFMYKDVFWAGCSYRNKNSVVALLGFQVNPQFSFGYSYEYLLSDLSKCSYGTHEIILRYDFGYKIGAINPRFF